MADVRLIRGLPLTLVIGCSAPQSAPPIAQKPIAAPAQPSALVVSSAKPSVPAPDALAFLEKAQEDLGKWEFHAEFRLPNESETTDFQQSLDKHWFKKAGWRDAGYRLVLIGVDRTHGQFCLWHHPDLKGREPPVVYLGSEGDTEIIATHAAAFVEALAAGLHQSDAPPQHAAFRTRAKDTFGFSGRSVEDIRKEAEAAHPSFAAWADAHE